jgi:hypothetical protein
MGVSISEAVKNMSKRYLGRVLESFTKDLGTPEEEEARARQTRANDGGVVVNDCASSI